MRPGCRRHPRRRPGSGIPPPPARPIPDAGLASAGYAWSQCATRRAARKAAHVPIRYLGGPARHCRTDIGMCNVLVMKMGRRPERITLMDIVAALEGPAGP